jgi:prolyl-tRNA synthetase
MTHGDDAGLILPPRLAPIQIVIIPIYRKDDERVRVLEAAESVAVALRAQGIRVHIDARDTLKPGPKYYEWERKGVPMRLEIGPRDVDSGQVMAVSRFTLSADAPRKEAVPIEGAAPVLRARLDALQEALLRSAYDRRESNSHRGITSWDRFREIIEGEGGFVYTAWCGSASCEEKVKNETKATIRVIPSPEFRTAGAPASCIVCGTAGDQEVVWARAY